MKKTTLSLALVLMLLTITFYVNAQQCAFDNQREILRQNPNYVDLERISEENLQNAILDGTVQRSSGTVLTIPVVVHVLHLAGEAIGTGSNISDAQIFSSINNLNDFYRGLTADSPVDFEIEFALAQRDPDCNATTGINRIDASGLSGYSNFGVNVLNSNGASYNDIKTLISWPQTDYFNIWIVTELDGNNGGFGFQGYAYFYNESSSNHGSVMMSSVFGYDPGNTNGWGLNSNGDNSTVVHELGHYFHLYHTFQGDDTNGDGASDTCPANTLVGNNSDGCADTVPHQRETSTCPSNNSCTGSAWVDSNTINNVMSYYNCTDRLTNDQKTRARAAMVGTAIANSNGDEAPDLTYSAPTTVCNTNTTSTNNSGITSVELNGVTYSSFSSASDGGNIDNSDSCSNYFEIDADQSNTINVGMFSVNWQQLGVWIDWNDDGDFDDDAEQQYLDNDIAAGSTVPITISYPSSIPYEDYVRVRLVTEVDNRYSGVSLIDSACYTGLVTGQSEDYTIYVQASSVLSVESNVLKSLKIYTSADTDELYIAGQLTPKPIADLYDINGRLLISKKLESSNSVNSMDVSSISSGIYIIKIHDDSQVKTQKIIIK
ncbi:MAG: T9SS C-terminal target domain-containing protein [Winogradskyella sp.]|uniref:GEVED domain-containing protein n=1 Tax=Winogradskyella sp. TaxID=1883156 RepID=UPI000F406207|nr:GEVED domain-containing protein [Winogradskyella sp.]RNC86281.1 MAG: T9SS C-terminal target domain-containing protein [Winogradskyella sp.]